MRIPVSWLREYVELPEASHEIAERLAMLGFPVEEIERRPHIEGVVVGRLDAVEHHPNADRLFVCRVDAGAGEPITIATAATNVAAGQIVPVARVGARLPHLRIERRTMRGVASEGMLCSPDELALPPEWFEADGIMQLDESLPIGGDVVALLGLGDDVLDVEITSNRVDAMCAIGLARELAASYEKPLRLPAFDNPGTGREDGGVRVELESPDCTHFVLQRFDAVRVASSPARMRVRLALCGVRPINNVVDVSNYVMLETGEPLHCYDAARVEGSRIIVRDAREDEPLRTLDGESRTLSPHVLAIADARGAIGAAGVMGGADSEVTAETQSILLEAATFRGARVRRGAQFLGLRTEASSRHERGVPPALADLAAARAAQLLRDAGAHPFAPVVAGAAPAHTHVTLAVSDVPRLLGIAIEPHRIVAHLVALGCTVREEPGNLAVTPPPWRADLAIAADLVEEVARIEGYDRIEAALPPIAHHAISSREYEREHRAARTMAAIGYFETVTLSFCPDGDEQSVSVRNPMTDELRFLRTDLTPSLLENVARIGRPYRLFEIAHTYAREGGIVVEAPVLGIAVAGAQCDDPAWRDQGFLRVKGDLEALLHELTGARAATAPSERRGFHPGKCATLAVGDVAVGVFGRVHPQDERRYGSALPLYAGSIRLDRLHDAQPPRYRPPSRYPSTYRDLALSVGGEVSAESVEATTAQAIGDICTAVRVFDEYRGPQLERGRKSLAVRATMQRFDGTITDDEADAAVARAVKALNERLGASVRV